MEDTNPPITVNKQTITETIKKKKEMKLTVKQFRLGKVSTSPTCFLNCLVVILAHIF